MVIAEAGAAGVAMYSKSMQNQWNQLIVGTWQTSLIECTPVTQQLLLHPLQQCLQPQALPLVILYPVHFPRNQPLVHHWQETVVSHHLYWLLLIVVTQLSCSYLLTDFGVNYVTLLGLSYVFMGEGV